ncbi:hypothetical protein EBT16_11615, partial [bacterium]|nr:hypothetical protein [bacterium]
MKETNTSWIISTIRDNKAVHTFKAKLSSWLGLRKQPPVITEQSSLAEIGSHYPGMWGFLENKYHLRKSQLDTSFSLASVSKQFDLPPAQILFMEIQLEDISKRIQEITALEAQRLLQNDSRIEVLDVREPWERAFGS